MNRPLMIAAAGGIFTAAALALNFLLWQEEVGPESVQADKTETTESVAPAPRKAPADGEPVRMDPPDPPSFDVVRINPKGDTVIAGRATPGAKVAILDGEKKVGEVDADDRGEWVFIPDKPLAPGERKLTLEASSKNGAAPVPSDDVVVLVVPEKQKDIAGRPSEEALQPLALRIPRARRGPTTVLQKTRPDSKIFTVTIDAVDYDDEGRLSISGRGVAGGRMQLYLDNAFIGRTLAESSGAWNLTPDKRVKPGIYTLRVDHVDEAGKVVARMSIPFARAEPLTEAAKGDYVIVQPGNSLWRLARHSYGDGFDFTVIYEANKDQIRDPDLIYPGQIFALPATN